jgi:sulfite reductase (NADPH) flavoprotein alpha-component
MQDQQLAEQKKTFYTGFITQRYPLTHKNSTKKTYHIELRLSEDIHFKVGDSIGITPMNDPKLVESLIHILNVNPSEIVQNRKTKEKKTLREFLLFEANLQKVTPKCQALFRYRSELSSSYTKNPKDDLLDYASFHTLNASAQDLCNTLLPQLPRFYSIASSASVYPKQLHLTVRYLETEHNNRIRPGVASHYLSDLAKPWTPISFFLFPSKGFTLPEDHSKDIIMVGPGTGIAPFRAFIQERAYRKCLGKNWLFFGERSSITDFFYKDDFESFQKKSLLRLTTAFSRDQDKKIYVQDRMLENGPEIWRWLQNGAFFYVCGDAKKMAKEVQNAVETIAMIHGGMDPNDAKLWMKELKKNGRYLQDVY